jgi:hypothetical protein
VGMQGIAALTGLVKLKKFSTNYWRWFVLYLVAITIGEAAGLWTLYYVTDKEVSRSLYSYIVIPVEFSFFFWLFYRYFGTGFSKGKWLAVGAFIAYAISWAVFFIFSKEMSVWDLPITYLTGIIGLLVLTMYFFIQFIFSEQILGFKTNAMFWVALGVFLFYIVSAPFFALRMVLYRDQIDVFWIYYYVQMGVNYLMYLLFMIALIWGQPR